MNGQPVDKVFDVGIKCMEKQNVMDDEINYLFDYECDEIIFFIIVVK